MSKPLTPLSPNQVVRLQTQKGHDKIGVIKRLCGEPHSYVVEVEEKEYRCNRRHILPMMEPQPPKPVTHAQDPDVLQHPLQHLSHRWTKHKRLKSAITLNTHHQHNVKDRRVL